MAREAREARMEKARKPSMKRKRPIPPAGRQVPPGRVVKSHVHAPIDRVRKPRKAAAKPRPVLRRCSTAVAPSVPMALRKRAGAEKGLRGRSVLDINILRLLGIKLPAMSGLAEPPADVGHFYGLTDEKGRRTFILNGDEESKRRPASPNYHVFASAKEASLHARRAPGQLRVVFTDGSHFPRTGKTGYAVWWGHGHANNAAGPVPGNLPLSSARAEEYAIFLALLQIKLETQYANEDYKYEIRTDSTWTIGYLSKWFRKWDKANSSVGWKTPPAKTTSQRDVLRVSAGILWDLRFSGVIVQFAYVPGHEGIEGNERANTMCRHAARTGETTGLRPIAF